jgi:hypothetical protein
MAGLVVLALFVSTATVSAETCKALFLSKSAGFQHSCITWNDQNTSHVDGVLKSIQDQLGAEILCTKDASLISAENLKNYRIVIFYTTADLTQEGTDKQPAMGPNGVADLLAWIKNGGGFMGYHCASDTFHRSEQQPESPFLDMLGGEFRAHGKQFTGTLRVVDPAHPTMAAVPANWTVLDEWYLFKDYRPDTMHVLALLDPGDERANQEMYNLANYPVIWCSQYGNGRVYYNAMGHREDVWTNPTFQQTVIDAAKWVLGQGPAAAEPNYHHVVPKEPSEEEEKRDK